jgi:nitroreductase
MLLENLNQLISSRRLGKPEQYNGKKIAHADLMVLLQNADWAPTHGFTEPWRFIVFEGESLLTFCKEHAELYKKFTPEDKFSQSTYEKIAHRGDHSSHLLATYMRRGDNPKIPEIEEICAVSCAVQNLWLTATAMGIDLYWGTGGMVHHGCMKAYFDLRPQDHLIGLLYLGYSDAEKAKGRRVTPLEEKIKWEK